MLELPDLPLKVVDDGLGLLHGGLHDAPLSTPPGNAFDLVLASAILGFDLLAELALHLDVLGVVDEFHAAGFAHPILVVALGRKASPRPVAAGKLLLVIEAHGYQTYASAGRPSSAGVSPWTYLNRFIFGIRVSEPRIVWCTG